MRKTLLLLERCKDIGRGRGEESENFLSDRQSSFVGSHPAVVLGLLSAKLQRWL